MSRRPTLLKRLRRDRRGVSAIEFAFIAPILITMYFCLTEFCQAYMAQKRASHVTSTIADLVAQQTDVTQADLDDVFRVGDLVMRPYPSSSLSQTISSVAMDDRGRTSVEWSRDSGGGRGSSNISLPDDLIEEGETIIVAEVAYTYDSPVDFMLQDGITFRSTYYLRPRLTTRVGCC